MLATNNKNYKNNKTSFENGWSKVQNVKAIVVINNNMKGL